MFSYIATCLQLRLTINQNKIGLSLPFMNNFRCSKIILWPLRSWSHIAYVKYRMYIKNVYCFRHFRPFQRKKWEGHSYNNIAILIETGYSLVQKNIGKIWSHVIARSFSNCDHLQEQRRMPCCSEIRHILSCFPKWHFIRHYVWIWIPVLWLWMRGKRNQLTNSHTNHYHWKR